MVVEEYEKIEEEKRRQKLLEMNATGTVEGAEKEGAANKEDSSSDDDDGPGTDADELKYTEQVRWSVSQSACVCTCMCLLVHVINRFRLKRERECVCVCDSWYVRAVTACPPLPSACPSLPSHPHTV
jgi:hypothetical protein